MRAARGFMIVFFCVIFLSVFFSCSESPFSTENISERSREIRGRLRLSDTMSYEGIYVWLEVFNIGTFTDSEGSFQITLPPPAAQDGLGGTNGVCNLFFYVANYKLSSATSVVLNGEFLYSRGDFDSNGELIGTRSLRKLVYIKTVVEPNIITADYQGKLSVKVALRAISDSVKIMFPKLIGASSGAILLRRLETGDIFVDVPGSSSYFKDVVILGPEEEVVFQMVFDLDRTALPEGQYEAIPFFLIEQENISEELLRSLGPNATELGPDFLKIPFRREGGYFSVIDSD